MVARIVECKILSTCACDRWRHGCRRTMCWATHERGRSCHTAAPTASTRCATSTNFSKHLNALCEQTYDILRKLALVHVCALAWETYQRFILAAALVAALLMRMSSMSQAAYHGVPVAALPFFGDQPGNAGQAVARVWTFYPFLYICIPWFLPLR